MFLLIIPLCSIPKLLWLLTPTSPILLGSDYRNGYYYGYCYGSCYGYGYGRHFTLTYLNVFSCSVDSTYCGYVFCSRCSLRCWSSFCYMVLPLYGLHSRSNFRSKMGSEGDGEAVSMIEGNQLREPQRFPRHLSSPAFPIAASTSPNPLSFTSNFFVVACFVFFLGSVPLRFAIAVEYRWQPKFRGGVIAISNRLRTTRRNKWPPGKRAEKYKNKTKEKEKAKQRKEAVGRVKPGNTCPGSLITASSARATPRTKRKTNLRWRDNVDKRETKKNDTRGAVERGQRTVRGSH